MPTLTSEQLDQAQHWLGSYYADEDLAADRGSRLPHDDDRKTCRDALVSYKKMLALFDEVEYQQAEQSTPTGLMFIEPLRRALEVK